MHKPVPIISIVSVEPHAGLVTSRKGTMRAKDPYAPPVLRAVGGAGPCGGCSGYCFLRSYTEMTGTSTTT